MKFLNKMKIKVYGIIYLIKLLKTDFATANLNIYLSKIIFLKILKEPGMALWVKHQLMDLTNYLMKEIKKEIFFKLVILNKELL
jgi:hypothetical protein